MNQAECRKAIIEKLKTVNHTKWDDVPFYRDDMFCMAKSYFDCGSPACVAGHIEFMMDDCNHIGSEIIRHRLGLPSQDAHNIFSGGFSRKRLRLITPDETIDALEAAFKRNPLPEDHPEGINE